MMKPQTTTQLSIGAVAKQSGFSIDTIRFYEREGLLPEPERRPSGYRVYQEDVLVYLRFIERAKELGFSLEEIAELLRLSHDNHHGVKSVKERTRKQLDRINQRIDKLVRVRDSLTQLVNACPGHGKPDDCPILNALTDKSSPLQD